MLAANRRRRRTRVTRTKECQLAGLVHHGIRGAMTTSFSYGRGGRLYRYYVAGSLDPTRPSNADAPLRVPAAPLEKLVLDSLTKLRTNHPDWEESRSMIERVEIWDRSVQMILCADALFEPNENRSARIVRLQEGLGEERLVIGAEGELRLIVDQAPKFRGGSMAREPRNADVEKEAARQRLRMAHRLLEEHKLSPLTPEAHSLATAPTDQRSRRKMALGLLAPGLQRRWLDGSVKAAIPEGSMPLAWADQLKAAS